MNEAKALSYSEMRCFYEDFEEYKRRYIEHIQTPPSTAMMLGSLVHRRMENNKYQYSKDLIKLGFNGNKVQIIKQLIERADKLPKMPKREMRVSRTLESGDKLFGIYDAFDPDKRYLVEYKTGDTDNWWTQETVDYDEQLSFYAYMYWLETKQYLRNITLYALNTNTGTIKGYNTVRSIRDFDYIQGKINKTIATLKELDLWDKRKSSTIKATLGELAI